MALIKNNKSKISVLAWNDKSELPDESHSVSDTWYYFEYIKNILWLINNLPLRFYVCKTEIKVKIFRLSSAWVKISQIPYANFETTCGFISKFCIPLQFHER